MNPHCTPEDMRFRYHKIQRVAIHLGESRKKMAAHRRMVGYLLGINPTPPKSLSGIREANMQYFIHATKSIAGGIDKLRTSLMECSFGDGTDYLILHITDAMKFSADTMRYTNRHMKKSVGKRRTIRLIAYNRLYDGLLASIRSMNGVPECLETAIRNARKMCY